MRGLGKSKITDKSRYKQNRGTGRLKDYKPWIRVLEVPSKGRSHRVYLRKTERHHELLSDMEEYFFWICVWDDEVIDIREQFPLLPQLKTQCIAAKFGYKHPVIPYTNQEIVMTTDFLLTKKVNGKTVNLARAVKTKEDLKKLRTREKLKIERQYWIEKRVDWALITEDSFSVHMAKNVKLLSNMDLWMNSVDIKDSHVIQLYDKIISEKTPFIDTVRIALQMDKVYGYVQGTFLNVFKYLIWTKQIRVDMTSDILNFSHIKLL